MQNRIKAIRSFLKEEQLDAYIVTSYENYRYFSGFTGSNCTLIITEDALFALTDGRYDIQIRAQAKPYTAVIIEKTMQEHIAKTLSECGVSRAGYESFRVTDAFLRALKSAAPNVEFCPSKDIGEEIRAVKSESEILSVRRAVKCSDDALCALTKELSADMTEREVAALLDYESAKRGSSHPAFDTIAASGTHSALPHAEPRDVALCRDSLMVLDFGATVGGYMSDITRTLILGSPSRELLNLWELCFEVQQKCVKAVRAGIAASELDGFCRSLFASHGCEKYFTHSLGHGVGLAIHEAPAVSRRNTAPLRENMIITIEPGLYVEGLGGVRTEDTVLVKKDCGEALTQSPHRIEIKL